MRRKSLLLILSLLVAACSTQKKEEAGAKPEEPRARASAHAHGGHAPKPQGDAEKAHADHNPRHGGVVTMEGDNHVEIVVAKDGAIDLYLSDGVRKPIAVSDASGTIGIEVVGKKEKQTLPLSADAAKGSLSAKGPPPSEKAEYTWNLKVRGAPMSMTLRVPPGGTAAFEEAGGEHTHGSPHGGVVQEVGDGHTHAEVKLEKGGQVTLWLLDDAEKTMPAKGVSASVRPVSPGSKDVKLDYDEKLDALRGTIDPAPKGGTDVLVTVTLPGGIPLPVRFKFPGEGGDHAGH